MWVKSGGSFQDFLFLPSWHRGDLCHLSVFRKLTLLKEHIKVYLEIGATSEANVFNISDDMLSGSGASFGFFAWKLFNNSLHWNFYYIYGTICKCRTLYVFFIAISYIHIYENRTKYLDLFVKICYVVVLLMSVWRGLNLLPPTRMIKMLLDFPT